jgi:SAM-dependent methyltransferase
MNAEKEYVLGTHDAEIERLGLQHRLWRHRTLDCWRRAGIRRGADVLDVGAGPGFATMELAQLVGPEGSVTALDMSSRFLAHLRAIAAQRGLRQVRAIETDLDQAQAWPGGEFDLIWCRWTHIFLRQPEQVLARLAKSLRPGGRIIIHEYSDYGAWRIVPAMPSFERFVTAVMHSWRQAGGDPDVGAHIPRWLQLNELQLLSTDLISYFLAPSDPMWLWPQSYVKTGTERLAQLQVIEPAEAQQIQQDFEAASRDPRTRTVTPTVIEIIAAR